MWKYSRRIRMIESSYAHDISPKKIEPFLDQIITGDEKCITYENIISPLCLQAEVEPEQENV